MVRRLKRYLLLSVLTLAAIENFRPVYVSLAQEPPVANSCNPEESLQSRVIIPLEQARTALENKKGESALGSLQEALPIALQLRDTRMLSDVLQQWLLDANEGYPTTRFQRLMQQIDVKNQSAQIQSVLEQLLQLTSRLTPKTSYVKTRSLAALARQYGMLGQSQLAMKGLDQARVAAGSIQGAIFTANGLLDVAEGYAAISQPQKALSILAQIEPVIQKIPPNTSEPLQFIILERMAATYAQAGDYAKAQQIAGRLPKNSDSQSVAQRGIVQAYIAAQNLKMAEQMTQAIAAPSQQVPALGKLAVAYHQVGQLDKAAQLLRQAVQLAQSPEVVRDPILQDALVKGLVDAHLQMGQRDEALKLAQSSLGTSKEEALKTVLIAYSKAGQSNRVEQWLSKQLSTIRSNPNEWEQKLYIGSLLQTAIETQQFEWIRQQWSQFSAIDYGSVLQDWQVVNMATAYAQTGQHLQAVQWVQQLPLDNRPVLRIKLLATIALNADQSGATEWANRLLNQSLQTIDPLVTAYQKKIEREGGDLFERDRIKPQALAAIAVVYARMGQAETTRQLLEQVIKHDVNMSDPAIAPPSDNPFAVFMEAQQYVGALQIAQGTKDSGIRESRLQGSATALLKQNRFDLVLPVVEQITVPNNKTQLLLATAQRYGELQQVDKALPLLAQAFQVAQTIPGEESEVMRFGADGLTVVDREDDRGSLLNAIALQYAQFKQFDQAFKVANALQEKQLREQAIGRIQCITRV
jgi:tetratricopeptide (TPR) repeat protein